MIQLKEVNRELFIYLADEYEIGTWNDEILEWIQDNVKEYQMYVLQSHQYNKNKIITELIVFEEVNFTG